jgi:undecaprenyl phosphate-alpha-L-ara4N flippase subunit ArnE
MKTHWWAIVLTIITTLFTSTAQIFYKMGASKLEFNLFALMSNYNLIIGGILYAIGAALMIIALKGGEVTVVYPIIATSYIWVSLLSNKIFGEELNVYKWIGIGVIILGITFISFGNKFAKDKDEVALI